MKIINYSHGIRNGIRWRKNTGNVCFFAGGANNMNYEFIMHRIKGMGLVNTRTKSPMVCI